MVALPLNGCTLTGFGDTPCVYFFAHQTTPFHSPRPCGCDRLVCSYHPRFRQFSICIILYSLGILYSFTLIFVLAQTRRNKPKCPVRFVCALHNLTNQTIVVTRVPLPYLGKVGIMVRRGGESPNLEFVQFGSVLYRLANLRCACINRPPTRAGANRVQYSFRECRRCYRHFTL